MAQINEAWRVLSDPGRRAVYDSNLRSGSAATSRAAGTGSHAGPGSSARRVTPRMVAPVESSRFPWRFMLVLLALGVGFILVNAALTEPAKDPPVDHLMTVGSCVDIADNNDAVEVQCGGPHDGVIDSMFPVSSICPADTEIHRDRQGTGMMCVRLVAR